MSSIAAPAASLAEELRGLAELLGAAAEKCGRVSEEIGQLAEENRVLNVRLAAAEEQLAPRNCELAVAEATNGQLLQGKRDLAERFSGEEPLGALVARVPELALFSSDPGQSAAVHSDSSAHQTTGSSWGAPKATVSTALSATPAQKTLAVGLLFPDAFMEIQGQHISKTMSCAQDIPAVKGMLEKAGAILGLDMWKLCVEGPANQLAQNGVVMYIACLAGVELWCERKEAVARAQVVAGMGVGGYAALTAAGVFSFEDGLSLVKCRCEMLIWSATAGIKQASAWVSGLDRRTLAALCDTAVKEGGSGAVCQIGAECFSLGFIVTGTERSVLALKELAGAAGALRTTVDPFGCALGTPLMAPAQEKMNAMLDYLRPKMNPPRTTVYMGATAAPVKPGTNPEDIVKVLKKELTVPALWEASVKAMIQEGVSEFCEVGPGGVLKNFMRRINAKVWRTMTNVMV